MTFEQQVLTNFEKIFNRMGRLERKLKVTDKEEDPWISEEEAMKITGRSKKYLYGKRKKDQVKYRCLGAGKGFQYKKSSIDKLYVTS